MKEFIERVGVAKFALLVGVITGLLVGGLTFAYLNNAPKPAIEGQAPIGKAKTYYALRDANMRNHPTAINTQVVGHLGRGDIVSGHIYLGANHTSLWLKIEGQDQYVSMINLSDAPPPAFVQVIDKLMPAPINLSLYARPDERAELVANIVAGGMVNIAGEIADGWAEATLEEGKVGYFRVPPNMLGPSTNPQVVEGDADGQYEGENEYGEVGTEMEDVPMAVSDGSGAHEGDRRIVFSGNSTSCEAYVRMATDDHGGSRLMWTTPLEWPRINALEQNCANAINKQAYFDSRPVEILEPTDRILASLRQGYRMTASDHTHTCGSDGFVYDVYGDGRSRMHQQTLDYPQHRCRVAPNPKPIGATIVLFGGQ